MSKICSVDHRHFSPLLSPFEYQEKDCKIVWLQNFQKAPQPFVLHLFGLSARKQSERRFAALYLLLESVFLLCQRQRKRVEFVWKRSKSTQKRW